ncbi:MAG TPA: response regulator [Thermoanaerobaculia bacterium]|nr:response regulator [Thermoanaerobaculia bacterium]
MKQRSRGRTALLCEDDTAIREMIRTVLARDGFTVEPVCDGASAIERLEAGSFDLIVLDLMMPGMNGFDIVDFLERHQPGRLKRVLITTAVPAHVAEKLPPSICHILPKPFDIERLLEHARSCSEDTMTRKSRRLLPLPTPG